MSLLQLMDSPQLLRNSQLMDTMTQLVAAITRLVGVAAQKAESGLAAKKDEGDKPKDADGSEAANQSGNGGLQGD